MLHEKWLCNASVTWKLSPLVSIRVWKRIKIMQRDILQVVLVQVSQQGRRGGYIGTCGQSMFFEDEKNIIPFQKIALLFLCFTLILGIVKEQHLPRWDREHLKVGRYTAAQLFHWKMFEGNSSINGGRSLWGISVIIPATSFIPFYENSTQGKFPAVLGRTYIGERSRKG